MQDSLPTPLNKDILDQIASIKEEKQSEILEQLAVPKYKEGIDFVFEQNPELEKMILKWSQLIKNREREAKQLYSEYLDTIFPESQMRSIVYHNSDAEFKDIWFKPMPPKFDTLNSVEGVYNFSTNRKFIQRYGKLTYAVLLNSKQAVFESNSGEYIDDLDRPLSELLFKLWKQKAENMFAPKYDPSLKNTDALIHYITGEEYVERHPVSGREFWLPKQTLISVFDPDQIHILWSQKDIECFQEWLKNKK